MKFQQYKSLKENLLRKAGQEEVVANKVVPSSLVLAYLGDSVFSLYVRQRLVTIERNKVRVLNDVSASMVSAVWQAKALDALESVLDEEELAMVRRGRNTKSAVPRSASVAEYRKSTGFECLLGWLSWKKDNERLDFLMAKAFEEINGLLLKKEVGD